MLNTTEDAVRRWGPAVYRMAYAMVRSRHDADDVFQEVFLRFHRSAPQFESEEHRKAWLLRVTVNCEGYSTDEIAKLLRRRPSTVRAQLTRARRKLSELLKEEL